MTFSKKETLLCLSVLVFGVAGPLLFPNYTFQIAVLWMMVVFAQTWDTLGGQMGYNSLGNIFFFGAGMYICSVIQISLYYDICTYTAHSGAVKVDFTPYQYFSGLAVGLLAAGAFSIVFAIIFGWAMFGLRGPYFAIGTLGVALAAGEVIGAWDCIGGGGGIS
ncbi:MAG: branched-chain amino acid ABC transporter permease, partial [Rhodospirillales bacterium]|nr:branched-chain amino acid ABC transporter permease [Rhodospirillales bacterium]